MITEFTDRRPGLSGLIIALLVTVAPGLFLLASSLLSGGRFNADRAVLIYTFALQVLLWLKVERPILVMLPFMIALLGFVAVEILYTVAAGLRPPGMGPGMPIALLSGVLVQVFGIDAICFIAGMVAYGLIRLVKKLWELAVRR